MRRKSEARGPACARSPRKHLGEPSKIDSAVAFQLNDAASYMTGDMVLVDRWRMTLNYTV